MCKSNVDLENIQLLLAVEPQINCVLGDFSSAYDDYSSKTLYTGGPSSLEHTNEYAPPEAIFGFTYNDTSVGIAPSFDLWSVGILVLEVLLGTPNVFSVDQRTRYVCELVQFLIIKA
jgi:serine/threonine protein kinase